MGCDDDDDWLIGCELAFGNKTDHDGCSYWVHTYCKGFPNSEAGEFTGIKYFCPEHNARGKEQLEEAARKSSKSSKRTRK